MAVKRMPRDRVSVLPAHERPSPWTGSRSPRLRMVDVPLSPLQSEAADILPVVVLFDNWIMNAACISSITSSDVGENIRRPQIF